ncbi:MAG: type I DNA topoisomerase [Bifidobacteriaceae bacterium]|nr:type I DNA topoisomerase [Bifidobacteriaceae bacterium]
MGDAKKLVIVESPTKAKTIGRYLGPDYQVEASVGHIRDLPQPSELPADMKKGPYGRFAVDVDGGFEPYYVVEPDKKKKVAELRRALKDAAELYLATDEDREGEAIAWHLLQVLKPKVPVKRMVFHEITKEAIDAAVKQPRDVDLNLVDAQETRRILDRLYGYEVSPVLWRKVRAGLSAGRVQSVATRMVVERERERMAFRSADYWDIQGRFAASEQSFAATLTAVDGKRVAVGKDFDDAGQLASSALVRLDEAQARGLAEALAGSDFSVSDLTEKPYRRRPAAPFTTSTLQQEASRKLRLNSRATMRLAQRLYENGHITYMRTDSTHLAPSAVEAARSQARELYGPESVPDSPRFYPAKAKGAQEAHEAIRPSGDHFKQPAAMAGQLSPDELKLYQLIWMRTVASQMTDATGQTVSLSLAGRAGETVATFSAAGTVITHRGFLAAYEEGRDQSRYDEAGSKEARLPELAVGQAVTADSLEPQGHQTTPPPRYTEASLVGALEKRGIGRPSTYAATVSVIEDRGYVDRRGMALVPSWLAFAVTRLLEENFTDLVDYDFTAAMETDLDRIAAGSEDRQGWLRQFYFGSSAKAGAPVSGGAATAGENADGAETGSARASAKGLKDLVENLAEIDARDINTVDLGDGIALRVGRYGPYLETRPAPGEAAGRRVRVPEDLAPDELTLSKAQELLAAPPDEARSLGTDPQTGHEIVAKNGRFGPYVTEVIPDGDATKSAKPRTGSLFKSMSLDSVTLEDALRLLALPRAVGTSLEGAPITAQNGRYGPYIKAGSESRSLAAEDQIFTVTEDEARALLAQPRGRRGAAPKAPLRELGPDPASGQPIVVKDGRFGPYVTDGQTNATLRQGDDPASVTLERAAELLADKRERGPAKRPRSAGRTSAKTASKTGAKTTSRGAGKTAANRTAAKTSAKTPAKGAAKGKASQPGA